MAFRSLAALRRLPSSAAVVSSSQAGCWAPSVVRGNTQQNSISNSLLWQQQQQQRTQPVRGFLGWDHQAWLREESAKVAYVPPREASQAALNPMGMKLAAPMPIPEDLVEYEAELRVPNNYRCAWLRKNGRLPASLHLAGPSSPDTTVGFWFRARLLQM